MSVLYILATSASCGSSIQANSIAMQLDIIKRKQQAKTWLMLCWIWKLYLVLESTAALAGRWELFLWSVLVSIHSWGYQGKSLRSESWCWGAIFLCQISSKLDCSISRQISTYFGWFEWVLAWNFDVNDESTALIACVFLNAIFVSRCC